MPVLRLQQPRAPCRRRRGTVRARLRRRDRGDRGARAEAHRVVDLLWWRHAVADAAFHHRSRTRRHRAKLECRRPHRGDARSQPNQRRSHAVSRLSYSGGQSRLALRAGARRSRAHGTRPAAFGARGARCGRRSAIRVRPLFVRSHLRASGSDAVPMGKRAQARARAGEHLSLYQLTIEPDTPFAALHAAGKLKTPDEDTARALYDTTQEVCAAHGLPAYEISNHARPGGECRHNLIYWRAHEYAGIGPGAHGRLDVDDERHATATEKRPESWLMRVEARGHGLVSDDVLTREERCDEFLLMGLRLAEGIDLARYTELAGRSLDPARIVALHEHGLIETTAEGRLRVTLPGFPLLDAVVADLAA